MEHFVGLDVSVRETSLCVVDHAGKIVKEAVQSGVPFRRRLTHRVAPICAELRGVHPRGCGEHMLQ